MLTRWWLFRLGPAFVGPAFVGPAFVGPAFVGPAFVEDKYHGVDPYLPSPCLPHRVHPRKW